MKFAPKPTIHNFIDLTGKKFTRWVVLGFAGDCKYWWCICDCGKTKRVCSQALRNGTSKGCGCIRGPRKHGLSKSKQFPYSVWWDMIARCEHKDHKAFSNYGARGIKVCEEWHDITQFYKDVGPRPKKGYSIDRIDNNGNYEPGNCRWTTHTQQCRNTRKNKYLAVDGVSKTQAEWAEIYNIRPGTIGDRLELGWNDKDAVTLPVRQRKL